MAKKKINRNSINLLPSYFRTDKNGKFLSSTVDQLISEPAVERINGFVGSKLSKNYNPKTDVYIKETFPLRQQYSLEPALVIKDDNDNIKKSLGYDDLINQISYYGGNTSNLDRLFRPKFNSYNPHVDWDKFVNFREYYWLPTGPDSVSISGLQRNTVSTYKVTDDGNYFIFTPDGLTEDPLITLYRGITYVFNVDSKFTLYIKLENISGTAAQLTNKIYGNGTKQITLTVDETTPSVLFYNAKEDDIAGGRILVKSINENSFLDVETEILGKSQYTSGNGIEFINGLKIKFVGKVVPTSYSEGEYIVEGVGSKIKLIDFTTLVTPERLATSYDTNFDANPFDEYPFDNFKYLPIDPEYITINRSSNDLNPWSRYNRWFHGDVIKTSAVANGLIPSLPSDKQAKRPIIEFFPNFQLWNFATVSAGVIDLIDETNKDVFSSIENSIGYHVDGILLEEGYKVVFNADPDPLVRSKIFQVGISIINGKRKIDLREFSSPAVGEGVLVASGDSRQGTEWWFDGTKWNLGQERNVRNQPPLFDLFDKAGNSYTTITSEFVGNKVFGYVVGSGTVDPVLGFPLKYKNDNQTLVGTYLFQNYFSTDNIKIRTTDSITIVPTTEAYLRLNNSIDSFTYDDVWTPTENYQIPIIQFQVVEDLISSIEVNVVDKPGVISNLTISIFVNDVKQIDSVDYNLRTEKDKLYVDFTSVINGKDIPKNVLFKCYTTAIPNSNGYYETPLNLTNNPLNGPISTFTLTELSDHVKTMVNRDPRFVGTFPGDNNLKSLPDISKYGTRLISNQNPLSFAQLFISNVENSLISAIRKSALDYYQFKLNLIKELSQIDFQLGAASALDEALTTINQNNNSKFPYALSDMLGYGANNITRTYTVSDPRNTVYPLASIFSMDSLSNRSVIVYVNNIQLLYGQDYTFDSNFSNVIILTSLTRGDKLLVRDYLSTVGSYIPPTPTKLGLYPKFTPSIFIDNSYAQGPIKVIQGHDGSITVAFSKYNEQDDFRDLILLEYEKRVYNNLKTIYNPELVNINDIFPGVFRNSEYTFDDVYNLIQIDFLKWTSTFGLDFTTNSTYDIDNFKTYNYRSAQDHLFLKELQGNWRGIYKYYFDTDRPNTHPWEMLGFSEMPDWWESEYGPAPYTSGNLNLWQDLEKGLIKQGARAGVDPTYVRTGLSQVIPVDASGDIIDVREWAGIGSNEAIINTDQNWIFGDCGPVETAWRRSSLWPFVVQIVLALSKPADYAAKMFDTSRLKKDITGQYNYGDEQLFLNPKNLSLFSNIDNNGNPTLAAGYGVWVIEWGKQKIPSYLTTLKQELDYLDFNLMYKAGSFMNQDKLEVIIDSLSPATSNPGVILPNEDYILHFNVSNPVKSIGISGIIIEKRNATFIIKGYDKKFPYFTINKPVHLASDSALTVGGKTESFLRWTENSFYQTGQAISYNNSYFRVVKNHNSGSTFTSSNYLPISSLTLVGGVSVSTTKQFEKEETIVPYGTAYSTLQEVYDLIVGYGNWLVKQGFMFDEYNQNFGQVLDWYFSGKEFLFWTTQNWADGSVITLSPFADYIRYQFKESAVDNIFDSFYDYSLLKADGAAFPSKNISVSREDGVCTIKSKNIVDGIFFARLNSVQKEHALILNNITMFNDVVYDIETGYRQLRVKLAGFKTANWDGDFLSPGFIYDNATITSWTPYTDYHIADVVNYAGNYYSANKNLAGTETFNFNQWTLLGSKPVAQLLPNFDYKINQFEDFYSLDIDNFDLGQQKMAQHLIGYTPRTYLDNIFVDPIAQYKFYQGFIKEKGTKNAIDKLAKASLHNLQGQIDFNEEWAFRIGSYGNFTSFNEIRFPLKELDFKENSQIVKFVDTTPILPNDVISYINPSEVLLKTKDYDSNLVFPTIESTFDDPALLLSTAGYVRTDDVTATAFNKNSLLDIANNGNIKEGNTIWLGFRDDGQWDVYRYTKQKANVINSSVTSPQKTLTFQTDRFHNLSVGEIISVYGLSNGSDGVYIVNDVPSLSSFSINTSLTTVSSSTTAAILFKFASVRINSFDDVINLQDQISFKEGDIVWSDSDSNGKWSVYQKTDNFTSINYIPDQTQSSQNFSSKIAAQEGSSIVVISAPNYLSDLEGYGRVFVYTIDGTTLSPVVSYGVNKIEDQYVWGMNPTQFGSSLLYDNNSQIIVASAPSASYVNHAGTTSTYVNEGLVKISKIDSEYFNEVTLKVITNPDDRDDAFFGNSLFLSKNISYDIDGKVLLVSAVTANGHDKNGIVYPYKVVVSTSTATVTLIGSAITTSTNSTFMGNSLAGNNDGTRIAISAHGANDNTGEVLVYSYNDPSFEKTQTITAPSICKPGAEFGKQLVMSDDGVYLIISSTNVKTSDSFQGKVFVYKWNTHSYVLNQTINNPSKSQGLVFGNSLKINSNSDTLIVSSLGNNTVLNVTFDESTTTFDGETCNFTNVIENAGTAYVFNRYNEKFVLAEQLFDNSVRNNSGYGASLSLSSDIVFVGAPADIISNKSGVGSVYLFSKIDPLAQSWKLLRHQEDLIDISKIKKSFTIDSQNQQVLDYLDIIDPVKGRISGLADQEIRYKTAFDPAVYSLGVNNVTVDTDTSWIDERVGELWWDLSTAKYLWYEQGDLKYRKNSWGKLFPGSSIDVYEWVRSEYLPSQWSSVADTTNGLSLGISGQPKYPDNSVMSVKQYFNSISGATTNVYYYWVKNKATNPSVNSRRLPAIEVARLIYDISSYGSKYISIIAPDAITVTNVGNSLVAENVYLNIVKDEIDNINNQHTEWLLIAEGSDSSMPNTLLEKKLLDSLLGKDSLGNTVPDPSLPESVRYGIEIRPRQGIFKDRIQALRNVFEYVNDVLSQHLTTDFIDFINLNSKEEIPEITLGEYDNIVEYVESLDLIKTTTFETALLSCQIENGRIVSVGIDNSGRGYLIAPSVEIQGNESGAIIKTEIDSNGSVIAASIIDAGQRFVEVPSLIVRPFSVIVQFDSTSNNKWTKYWWQNNQWVKIHTQSYDTTQFWDYKDWAASSYDSSKPLINTLLQPYLLESITTQIGDYVKILNQGNGKYIILERIADGSVGTFNSQYNLVYSESATIQFKDSIWNSINSIYNFDETSYDDTWYDRDPSIELSKILFAIRHDIFIGSLKVYWNKLFFKSVKYALHEQIFLDWAFKTSFINVRNLAGLLNQRPVYKLQNSQYYEDYINEVKPYRTQIRNFQVNYDILDPSNTYTTDFDLPAVYDENTGQFSPLEMSDPVLNSYPYKGWNDNHAFKIDSIVVNSGGEGYTFVPRVDIIPAPEDTSVTPATAKAYISLGKVIDVEVVDPGDGYTRTPTVVFSGGGYPETTEFTTGTIVSAKASVRLTNGKVRTNFIEMKFDRVSANKELLSRSASDSFECDGNTFKFDLTWAADHKKSGITVTVGSKKLLAMDYDIETYKSLFNDYHKLYSRLVLNFTPDINETVSISYIKNLELYHAADRIDAFYNPTSGMPGKDPAQLMSGVDFPGTQIETLPFSYSTNWDILPFTETSWGTEAPMQIVVDDGGSGYFTEWVSTTTTLVEISPNLADVPENITDATAIAFIQNGKVVDVKITNYGNGYGLAPTATITAPTTGTTATMYVEFITNDTPDYDLDSVIDGGNLSYTSATGLNPEDVILSGDQFISSYYSHGPEELIPGEVRESIGINVYTRRNTGSPVVYQTVVENSFPGEILIIPLSITPPNESSVIVSFNNTVLNYQDDYNVDFINKTLILVPRFTFGLFNIAIVDVGGTGFLSSNSVIVSNKTTAELICNTSYDRIGSSYVTLNGVPLTTSTYTLSTVSKKNRTGKITVTGISTGTNIIQGWFFEPTYKAYNEIKEQIIQIDGSTHIFEVEQFPGNSGPIQSPTIVELNKSRLTPPSTVFYTATSSQLLYDIDPDNDDITGIFGLYYLEVYLNGARLRNGIDFILNQYLDQIEFLPGQLNDGDEIAITNTVRSQYHFEDGNLIIDSKVPLASRDVIKIITFTNHDNMAFRTEVFKARSSRRYPLGRTITNNNYVWVTIGGNPLTNGFDYYIDEDQKTVIIGDNYPFIENDKVIISSISDKTTKEVIGYRVFKDILNRTHYKRLSEGNSAKLMAPLYTTSTSIHVDNASALGSPNPLANSPGVVLIEGERIEFMEITGNIISGLRRATLGTGASEVYPIGTKLIDQGVVQTIPYRDTVNKVILTATTAVSYTINNMVFNESVNYHDQVEVFYGGIPLHKPTPDDVVRKRHDLEITYDSGQLTAAGISGDVILAPEFTITGTTINKILTLNLDNDVKTGVIITVIQRLATDWYDDTGSLLDDSSKQAYFLRDRLSTLPDKYHYG